MKKLFFATMMCIAAMSANAQVLTSETVNNVYEEVSNKTEGDFYYNADRTGNNITTMYIYKNDCSVKGYDILVPYMKYDYDYAADGFLNSRVTYHWNNDNCEWECTGRHDYMLTGNTYFAEFSHYNSKNGSFDQPVDKMIYSMYGKDSVNTIISYHRDSPSEAFRLVSETAVKDPFNLFAKK